VYINGGLSEQFSESQAAFGKTFSATGGRRLWVAGTSFLKRITERIFTISKWFHGSKKKLYSSQKDSQKSRKPSALIKRTTLILRTIKKIFIS